MQTNLGGIDFQEALERAAFRSRRRTLSRAGSRVGDFLEERQSGAEKRNREISAFAYPGGVRWFRVTDCLPEVCDGGYESAAQMARRIRRFDMADAVMTGVETRSSAPVRILRDQNLQSVSLSGLYPGGEGAGYAGRYHVRGGGRDKNSGKRSLKK